MKRPLLTSPDFSQEKCQSSQSDFSSSPPPKGGEVGEVNEDRNETVRRHNNEERWERWERSMTSTVADCASTVADTKSVCSDFPSGSFPAIKRHYRICTICGGEAARWEVGLPIAPPSPTNESQAAT